jgi:hypothetical protein
MVRLALAVALSAAALAAPARAESIAVLELRSRLQAAERSAIDPTYLTDRVRAAALESAPGLRVMTRENVLVLLKSLGRTLEECEGECEVETGRKLGADLVLSGELLHFGQGLKASLRLHDTRDGRLLAAQIASGASAEELDAALGPAVASLLKGAPRGQPESAQKLVAQEATPEERAAQRDQDSAPAMQRTSLNFELRAGLVATANFAPVDGAFSPGAAGIGLRLGAVTALSPTLLFRWGAGVDLKAARVSESWSDAIDGPILTANDVQTMLSVPIHLGLAVPLTDRTSVGLSWVPALVRRTTSAARGTVSGIRVASFEAHLETAVGAPSRLNGFQARLKAFLELQPQVGYKDGDDYVGYASVGLGIGWY